MSKYEQGKFKVKYPKKYSGDPSNINFRSSWEFSFMMKLDHDPNVIMWESEPLAIKYLSPIDNRIHRYFPDFIVKYKNGKTFIYEIKPLIQSQKPKATTKKSKKRLLNEAITYEVNQAKWKACVEYCRKHGIEFKVLTEKELKIVR